MTTGGYEKALEKKVAGRSAVVCVVGLGYVGLPTAVFFAEKGFRTVGADIDGRKVEAICRGDCPLHDLNLDERVRAVVKSGRLSASTDIPGAVKGADVVLIVVPTPVTHLKDPDLGPVISAGAAVARGLRKGMLVVLESTTYPGTTDELLRPILEKGSGLGAGSDFGLAYCPERYNPGDPEHTLDNVARIVGGMTPGWGRVAHGLYSQIIKRDVMLVRDCRTAEAAKVIENIQRDLNIALMNELAMIFERMGIDVFEVIRAASTKWNFNVYYPGAGVGGHCLPVDPYYLVKKAAELGYHAKVITAGRAINDHMPVHMYELLSDALNECGRAVKGSNIVVLGFSYKANVGDPRETPVETLLHELLRRKAEVTVVDPHIGREVIEAHGAKAAAGVYEAAKGADAVVVMTEHAPFRKMDMARLRKGMRTAIFVDGRRLFEPADVIKAGFVYRGVGAGGYGGTAAAPATR